ncbi:denticleless protein homolog isoform X2 [Pelodiscus sinensis]|uniref:denticleless protein homolog isoform X2 n=1 Tax=Pelodiscus sinensis TaxID=13735 RepID=UPI003F6BE702
MLCRSLLHRARDGPQRLSLQYPLQHLLDCYECSQLDDHFSYGETGMPVPPFGCTFSTASDLQHVFAVANEEGFVRLYDTETQNSSKQIFREWLAHSNAVFDLAWVPGEHRIVTASGDQTAKMWDVGCGELLGICKGHQCSLKSVAFSKFEKAVFCTGGRDGNIMVWDTRCNKKDGFYRQVNQIGGAHNVDKQISSKSKKKKQNLRGLAPSVDFQQSVTVVLLQDEHTLISAGAVDGVIKVWDLRKNYTMYQQDPVPFKSFCYPGLSTRKLGYSSLVLDSTGTSLFANCTDDNIYMFNMTSLKTTPVAVFNGHQNSSFYVKSSTSPDDQFLISGSSDQSAYIWKISDPHLPPMMLLGHSQEVTSVAWCPSDFTKITTCSDDNTVRIWRLQPDHTKRLASSKVSLVGWVCQKKPEEQNVRPATHSTPAKDSMVGSPCISSPRPAACAPSCVGDLPRSTNTTTSSLKSPAVKAHTPAKQSEAISGSSPKPTSSSKMSIKNWVTRTLYFSPPAMGAKTPSPRKALAAVSQDFPKTVDTPISPLSQFEKQAKRRLESSKGNHMGEKCLKGCSCVTELDPVAKKPKLDWCFFAAGQKASIEDYLSLAELTTGTEGYGQSPEEPSLPESPLNQAGFQNPPRPLRNSCRKGAHVLDKENSSPGKKNWLSAMGEKLKTSKASSLKASGNSPPSYRNPSIRQKAATAASPPGSHVGSFRLLAIQAIQ